MNERGLFCVGENADVWVLGGFGRGFIGSNSGGLGLLGFGIEDGGGEELLKVDFLSQDVELDFLYNFPYLLNLYQFDLLS